MGIFTHTVALFGFWARRSNRHLVCNPNGTTLPQERKKIKQDLDHECGLQPEWSILDRNGFTVFVPKTRIAFPGIDPMIDEKDIKQGFVSFEQMIELKMAKRDSFDVEEKEMDKLLEVAKVMGVDKREIKPRLIEYQWSTYMPDDDGFCFVRTLPIE